MSNILAIAHKDMKGYFASPIAYVDNRPHAIMFGYFFYALLPLLRPTEHADGRARRRSASQCERGLIRPVFLNTPGSFSSFCRW